MIVITSYPSWHIVSHTPYLTQLTETHIPIPKSQKYRKKSIFSHDNTLQISGSIHFHGSMEMNELDRRKSYGVDAWGIGRKMWKGRVKGGRWMG